MINKLSTAVQYAKDVRKGAIETNRYVKLAVDRYFDDLANGKSKGIYFDDKAAQKALSFFDFLKLSKGDSDGSGFKLEPWQSFIIANIYGWKKKEDGKRRFTEAYIEIPKKNGKALAIDTPIPTPTGWTTMGELKEGDSVFDEQGKPCKVTFATEIMYGHTCYEVVFSDGSTVVADEEHLWNTGRAWDICNGKRLNTVTTLSIKKSLIGVDGVYNHFVLSRSGFADINGDINFTHESKIRRIVSVNPVPSVPVRCIQVDSPKHLYLCGDGFIPTHNTTLGAGVGLECLSFDNENGPEVYAAAYTRDQASILFDEAVAMVERSTALNKRVKKLKYSLTIPSSRAKFTAVSHDAKNTEGKNSHCVLFDEYHVHTTDGVKVSLQSGMAARTQPLFFIITTAGDNKRGPCYLYREICKNILESKVSIDNMFAIIYGIDEEDDWKDEKNWIKANPNINVSVRLPFLRGEFKKALLNGRAEVEFKTKHLNVWVDAGITWIPNETWMELADGEFQPPKGAVCYGGLDLATTSDICSYSLYFPDYNFITVRHYVPEGAVKKSLQSGVDYTDWVRDGYLTQTPGNTTDYNYIRMDVMADAEYYDVRFIGYDRWNSSDLVQDLNDKLGTTYVQGKANEKATYEDVMQKFGQGFGSMSTPTKYFEKIIMDGKLTHDKNPVTAWMLGNVALSKSAAGDIKPDKGESKDKIDGIVAMVMAIGQYLMWNWSEGYETEIGVF